MRDGIIDSDGIEGVDQIGSRGRSQSGAEVIAGHSTEKIRAAAPFVITSRSVVKTIGIAGSGGDRIDGGIEKTNRGMTVEGRLLIDQRSESRPQRRGATSATKSTCLAAPENDPYIVTRQRDVRNISFLRRFNRLEARSFQSVCFWISCSIARVSSKSMKSS